MIRQATSFDYIRLLRSIQSVSKSAPYISKEHLKNDIENGCCYVKVEKEKFVAICSLVYSDKYKMNYGKRLVVPNKKNHGKGYAKEMLEFLKNNSACPIAVTPWKENQSMNNLLTKLGFKFQYDFQENFKLYLYKK